MGGLRVTRLVPDLPDETRTALVVATSSYQDPELSQLRAPAHDAEDLAEVLGDPGVGAFNVTRVIDADERRVRREIDVFLSARGVSDVVVLYLSCHGVLDRRNRLYFAAADTLKTQLGSTGVPSAWLMEQLEECRARRKVLVLDCCFSGAFAHGSKGDADLDLQRRLTGQGRGLAVLTASRAGEYSFEGEALPGVVVAGSVFTAGLVEGLRTGAADVGGDGYVSVHEAFDYACGYVQSSGASQTPQQWLYGGEGDILLARSPAGATITPVPLPAALAASLDSPYPAVRTGAVNALGELFSGDDVGLAWTAGQKLRHIADTDVPAVAAAARACLTSQAEDQSAKHTSQDVHAARSSASPGSLFVGAAGTRRLPLSAADTEAPVPSRNIPTNGMDSAVADVPEAIRADLARAKRLIGDAVSAARSITWDESKASTLASLASALAVTDPELSARLFADAEQVARSITNDHNKSRPLASIAKAQAATDPDRAERIAQTITDDYSKAGALAEIAKAQAASDPDRAERIAQTITSEAFKARALAEIAKAQAASDPERSARLFTAAERGASSIDNNSRADALADVAAAIAATDPDRAERIARSITDEELSLTWTIASIGTFQAGSIQRNWPLARVANALAADHPDRSARLIADAERVARSRTNDRMRINPLADVAGTLAAFDPDSAQRIAQSITNDFWKGQVLREVAAARATSDPNRSERIARSITDGYSKARALAAIAKTQAATDPEGFARLIEHAEKAAQSIPDASGFGKVDMKPWALADIAGTLAAADPDRAERVALSIKDEVWKASALADIAEALAAVDPDRAERIARSITDPGWKASALLKIATTPPINSLPRGGRPRG